MIKETVIPEMEICWKHVKKCSGSIVKAATETARVRTHLENP